MVEAGVFAKVAVPFSTHGTLFTYTLMYITFTFEFVLTLGTRMRLLRV